MPPRVRVRTKLLVVVGIPFLVSVAVFALFVASRSISERSYGAALAWSEHAGAIRAVETQAERFVNALGQGLEAVQLAGENLERARMSSLELARGFSEEEQAAERELTEALRELVARGVRVAQQPTPQAIDEIRRFYAGEVLARIRERVLEEQAGSKEFTERGRAVSTAMLEISVVGASVLLLIGLGLCLKLSHSFTRSLSYLQAQASRLAKGDLQGTITLASRDELGQLASAFSAMAADLHGSMILRSELETLVEHRTKELMQAEERLRQSQKLDAIGRLAGGVAHDFNNLLAVIMSNAEMVADTLGRDHPARSDLDEILAASVRAGSLTRQLLTFSRTQACNPQRVAVNDVVSNLRKMLSRIIGEDIHLTTELTARPGTVKADIGQLEQVLTNLVVNARDAMPGGGELAIETHQVELTESRANEVGVPPGSYLMLAVTDTGCGMDEATRARVFEPFFTTKELGKGTGLGLATVFGIVKQSDGAITVESQPNRGSTFRIYLPLVEEGVTLPAGGPGSQVSPGSETLLVVEDEDQVRSGIVRALRKQGYRVLEVRSGEDALKLLDRTTEVVQLMLTDLVMPGMHGLAVARELERRWPAIKVIFMSGYSEHAALHNLKIGPNTAFIAKPFAIGELAALVSRTLENRLAVAQASCG